MKSWGDAMGVMGDMVKAPDTFDAAVFKEQAAFWQKIPQHLGVTLKTKKLRVMQLKQSGLMPMASVLSLATSKKSRRS